VHFFARWAIRAYNGNKNKRIWRLWMDWQEKVIKMNNRATDEISCLPLFLWLCVLWKKSIVYIFNQYFFLGVVNASYPLYDHNNNVICAFDWLPDWNIQHRRVCSKVNNKKARKNGKQTTDSTTVVNQISIFLRIMWRKARNTVWLVNCSLHIVAPYELEST